MQRVTKTFALGLLSVGLLFCGGGEGSEERAAAQPPRPGAPPGGASPPPAAQAPAARTPAATPRVATRVAELPAISGFTPSLVARLRAVRAAADARNDDVFMKVGDSSTVSRGFLECLEDDDEVDLAGRAELVPTLEHFRRGRAGHRSPFRRSSLAAREGWSARHVLAGRPAPLLAEMRAIRPRFALVMNGGNDVEGHDDYAYAERMIRIVEMLTERGVIPVLNSLPPRTDDPVSDQWARRYNQASWAVSRALHVPYLDYHQIMRDLPRHGLAGDGVHPNILLEDGRGHACRFDEEGLRYGHNARNLLALRALDQLRRTVVAEEAPPDPEPPALEGDGTVARPFELSTLPFAELRDTRREGSSEIDAYPGCGADQDEGGRELVYRLVVEEPLSIRAMAVGRGGADLDVHVLREAPEGAACVVRGDREVTHALTPGTWYVVVDTFRDGTPRAGEAMVLIAPAVGPPPPAMSAPSPSR